MTQDLSPIHLIDADHRRRMSLSREVSTLGFHVEPYDGPAELLGSWPRSGILVVADEQDAAGEILLKMQKSDTWLPAILYSRQPTPRRIVEVMYLGAIDYLSWPFGAEDFSQTRQRVSRRTETVLGPRFRAAAARSKFRRLSPREREVIALVADGQSSKAIAKHLALSHRTVEIHRANAIEKLGTHSSVDAVRLTVEAQLFNGNMRELA